MIYDKNLSQYEQDLKEAINYSPYTVSASKMEKFSELMVRSLEGKSDLCNGTVFK